MAWRRRPHLARTVIGLLAVVALWIVLARLGWAMLQRPVVRAWMAGEASRQLTLATGRAITIGDVRLSLYPTRATLSNVVVGDPEAPTLTMRRCEVAPGRLHLAEREFVLGLVRLHGVRLRTSVQPAGGQRRDDPLLRVAVRQLELSDVEVDGLSLPSGIVVHAAGFETMWTGSHRQPAALGVVRIDRVRVEVPGIEPIEGEVSAWGRRTPFGWEVEKVRGHGDGWSLSTGLQVTRSGRVRAAGQASIDVAVLDRVVHAGAGLTGQASVDFTMEAAEGAVRLDARVVSPAVEVSGFRFENVDGEAHLTDDALEASLAGARFAGGQVNGSYSLASLGPPWSHRIAAHGTGVDLARFLKQIGVPDAGLGAACRVSAELGWEGGRIGEGNGVAVVEVAERPAAVPVSGRLVLRLPSDGAIHFDAPALAIAGGRVSWDGTLALGSWMPNWRVRADGTDVVAVAGLVEGWVGSRVLPDQLRGRAAVDVRLRGPFPDLRVVGDVAAAPVSFGPAEADGVEASFEVARGVLTVDEGRVFVGGGAIDCTGTLSYAEGNQLDLLLVGRRVPLAGLAAWAGVRAPLGGRVDVDGSVAGTLDAPVAHARLRFAGVTVAGVPFGAGSGAVAVKDGVVKVSELAIGPLTADVAVDLLGREASVHAALRSFGLEAVSPVLGRLAGGAFDCTLEGQFPFDAPSGQLTVASARGAQGTVTLDGRGLSVALERPGAWHLKGALRRDGRRFSGRFDYGIGSLALIARDIAGESVPVDGIALGEADVEVRPPAAPRVAGKLRALAVEVEGVRAVIDAPVEFTIDGGSVRLGQARLLGPGTALAVEGARAADGSLNGRVEGDLPAALLSLVWPDARPRGRVVVEGELSGTDRAPRFEGRARVKDGSLQLAELPYPITDVNGDAEIVPEAIHLSAVRFGFGGGRAVCDGQVLLQPRLELDLGVRAEGVRWPLSAGLVPIASGNVRISGPLDAVSVAGDLALQRTVYRQPINLQRLIVQQLRAPERALSADESAVALNLRVRIPGTLEVNTPLARLAGQGELRVVGTSNRPGVVGRVEALPGAELELSGVRYELERAAVSFSSPEAIEPFLDVLAHASVQNVEISVGLLGTLDRLTPTFASNPPLPEMDIVALLSMGRPADQVAGVQAGTVASSFLSDELTGAVTNRARSLLALDQLRVDPLVSSTTGDPTARLTVVKQLSTDWTVAVSTNLASNREEVVSSRWRLGSGMYLEAMRESDGSYSLEVKWQRRY